MTNAITSTLLASMFLTNDVDTNLLTNAHAHTTQFAMADKPINKWIMKVEPIKYDIYVSPDFDGAIIVGTNKFKVKRVLVTNVTEVITVEPK